MDRLGEIEIDFIQKDLESRGIKSEDLRDNLLDHICCILENEQAEKENFYAAYEAILPRFFKTRMAEIQIETDNLLTFKHFYIMKTILKYSGIATVILTLFGALFKSMHWPGANVLIILGGFFFSIIFMPLLIIIKMKDDESKTEKVVFSFGFLLAISLIVGILFKLMHWPFANILLISSTVLFTFIYVPIYFITGIRHPNKKFNVAVNSVLMLACGSIFFSLFNLGYSQKHKQIIANERSYLADNLQNITESNLRLISVEKENAEANEFHQLSQQVENEVDNLLPLLETMNARDDYQKSLKILEKLLIDYNKQMDRFQLEALKSLDLDSTVPFSELQSDLAMTVLSRLKQQLAVNENYYLVYLQTK